MTILRTTKLEPCTPGEWIDALIIRNIRMWHLQEKVYELDALERADREELMAFVKEATWMNLERTTAMDSLDATFARQVLGPRFQSPEAGAMSLPPAARQVFERFQP